MTNHYILLYLAKSSILSGILYAYYLLFLRNQKFHSYNRFYLLGGLFLSYIIPLFSFSYFSTPESNFQKAEKVVFYLSSINVKWQENNWLEKHWLDSLIILSVILSTILFAYLIYQVYCIKSLKKTHVCQKISGIDFIETEVENAPFSFWKTIYWKKSIDLQSRTGQTIFKHELTHIKQGHTLDRIFCQVLSSIFWMNPINWLIQKELETIHEFIADQEAISGRDAKHLAEMILEAQFGKEFLNPVHTFYYSSIKRRLTMLKPQKTPKQLYLQRVLPLPLLALCAVAFTFQMNAQEKKLKAKDQTLALETLEKKDKELTRLNLLNVPTKSNKKSLQEVENTKQPLPFIDGKLASLNQMKQLNPNDIESMNVITGLNAEKKYGKDAKNGVVEITLKKNKTNEAAEETIPASYPGGMEALSNYLNTHLMYPEEALKSKVEGRVFVQFEINAEGLITDARVFKSPSTLLNEEAIRSIKQSGKWIPMKKNRENISSQLILPIEFKM